MADAEHLVRFLLRIARESNLKYSDYRLLERGVYLGLEDGEGTSNGLRSTWRVVGQDLKDDGMTVTLYQTPRGVFREVTEHGKIVSLTLQTEDES